ncbi:MAG TPA: hypothetical protein VHX11_02155 [Acidobacteriaceae bacterium]|jgi:hypothetical protein|nr:hypothetical protein [Acidobacteriaceae bacterium]
MSTDGNGPHPAAPESRLWFGFVTAAVAWLALGCLDVLIAWLSCMRQQGFGAPEPHPMERVAFVALAVVLLAVGIAGGVASYRNWRMLSSQPSLLETHAVERREFMALLGVIVSVTLGMGMVWLALPPFFLDLCWRAK